MATLDQIYSPTHSPSMRALCWEGMRLTMRDGILPQGCGATAEPSLTTTAETHTLLNVTFWEKREKEECLAGESTYLLIHQLQASSPACSGSEVLLELSSMAAQNLCAGPPYHALCATEPQLLCYNQGLPPALSHKYTYLRKGFLFAGAKSRVFQHYSADHDDIREFLKHTTSL